MGINGAAVASLITQLFANVIVSYLIQDTKENTYLMLKGCNLKFEIYEIKRVLVWK